jgi:hypothetical protein
LNSQEQLLNLELNKHAAYKNHPKWKNQSDKFYVFIDMTEHVLQLLSVDKPVVELSLRET